MEPHEVLGVRPGAARPEVTEAFRRFALRHHPDRGGDAHRFQEGLDAYRRLAGSAPPTRRTAFQGTAADVVFHRRTRPFASMLRVARHRLSAARSRP